jgi:quercetin dioxygenase-like cupin family protein
MSNEIKTGQLTITFRVEGSQSNGTLAMFEFTVPAGAKVPMPHYHESFDETIYGIEGVLAFTVDGKTMHIGPGDTCFIPRGIVHGFVNLTGSDAKALAIVTPARIGPEYFQKLGEIVNSGGPPDLERVKALMSEHGLVPVFQ